MQRESRSVAGYLGVWGSTKLLSRLLLSLSGLGATVSCSLDGCAPPVLDTYHSTGRGVTQWSSSEPLATALTALQLL